MPMLKRLHRAFWGACGLALLAGSAGADTLTDTLIRTYQLSPELEASRAGLRGTDENVAQARAGKRPNLSASIQGRAQAEDTYDYSVTDSISASLDAELNIYDNGQTTAAIEAAKAGVASTRATLVDTEQQVLLNAVAAYMDVRRDLQFVSVAQNNVRVLQQQVQAATDRFELGEVTRTDVSLAEARLAQARANLSAFEGQLAASREQFKAVVGIPANNLQPPPPAPALPRTLQEAEALAMAESPVLLAARFNQTQAEFSYRRAQAARGPSVGLTGSAGVTNRDLPIGGRDEVKSLTATIRGTLPIYQGGQLSSLERQAQQLVAQRQYQVQNTARLVRQAVASQWSNLQVARATVVANQRQVEAAQIAFEGVREEATLGARTTLDVLDREQELRDAQVQLASSQRDAYVAVYEVLAAIGLMTVEHLNLGIQPYNPDIYYSRVQSGPFSPREGGLFDTLQDRYGR